MNNRTAQAERIAAHFTGVPPYTNEQLNSAGQGEQCAKSMDTCSPKMSESPELAVMRLSTRLRLYSQGMESVSNLSEARALEIEELTVRRMEERHEARNAIEQIQRRSIEASEAVKTTASNLINFIINMKVTPINLRNYGEAGTPVNPEAMAQIIDGIAIGLHAIKRMAGGNGEGAVRFPSTPQGLEDWLKALHTSASSGLNFNQRLNDVLDSATGRVALYWCPTCKRHVHPENLQRFYPDVPSYTGDEQFHDACQTRVEVRRKFSGPEAKEPPVRWDEWQVKMGALLQQAGLDGDSVRGVNFFQRFGNGDTPEEVMASLYPLR